MRKLNPTQLFSKMYCGRFAENGTYVYVVSYRNKSIVDYSDDEELFNEVYSLMHKVMHDEQPTESEIEAANWVYRKVVERDNELKNNKIKG